jgi:hypothetical protein
MLGTGLAAVVAVGAAGVGPITKANSDVWRVTPRP